MPLCPQITNTPIDITPVTFAISAVSFTSTTATYTCTGHTFANGSVVTISDVAPDGYNGTFTISSVVAGSTITVPNTTNAAVTTATGTAWQAPTDHALTDNLVVYAIDTTDPTGNGTNYASSPPTATKVGDIWFDASNGYKLYRWDGTTWVSVQDTAIAAANSAATAAQTTANGKNKVFRQGTTPTASSAGDVWFDTSNDNAISRWDGTSWVANSLGNNALASISANKITAGTIDASVITVSNINAGNISTGVLAATRIAARSIDATKIIAGTITANEIATGTITASQIAAGTITASQIAAGTITASQIAAGTLSASNITTGTLSASVALSAVSGTVGGFTIGASSIYSAGTMSIDTTGNVTGSGTTITKYLQINGASGTTLGSNTLAVGGTASFDYTITTGGNITCNSNIYIPFAATTASAANVFINSSTGLLARVTSSLRYKTAVQTQEIPITSLLALQPKTYVDKHEAAERGTSDGLYRHLGLIAEEVAELDGLKDYLVNYDEKGRPDSLNYDRVAVALIPLIKNINDRLTALEAK